MERIVSIPKDVLDQLIKTTESTLLPYDTADRIISEVIKGGVNSRNSVVNILIEYAGEAIAGRGQFQKILLEHLKSRKES